ncbi:hypothetical protein M514_00072 [Trichuris suis]|uniref:WAP domain-containing protein n=1 Tax=Trichuris suis TaxID=68888 RepID=A0A085NTY9_9BILA|nr:hypothetical protein M513_00072 [Trichuris suis]KFD72935.1 hypothetical protein M514_00072 [Trichuris suis]KHJ43290.1 WAP-type 'four-disulfide core [Trichuris suis]
MPKSINLLVSITATVFLNAFGRNIGLCPYLQPPVTNFVRSCVSDNDCPGNEKCCYTSVGQECTAAIHNPFGPIVKIGTCPQPEGPRIPGAWFDACATDDNCPGIFKCCVMKYGTRCLHPVLPVVVAVIEEEVAPVIEEPIAVVVEGNGEVDAGIVVVSEEKRRQSRDTPRGSGKDNNVIVLPNDDVIIENGLLEETGSTIDDIAPIDGEVVVVNVIEENGVTDQTAVDNLIVSSIGFTSFWDHPGECPPEWTIPGPSRRCLIDFQCIEGYKCCNTVYGRGCVRAVQSELQPLPKAGFCPSPAGPRIQGKWSDRCYSDWNCVLNQKCCITPWGARCTEPSGSPSPNNNINFLTPGLCPEVQPASFGSRIDFCFQDSDCAAGWKCCMGRFGLECKVPLRGN